MKTRVINGIPFSSIILGTDYYGSVVDKKTAFSLYDAYTAYGGNFIDTAHLYVNGESEKILGKWIKVHGRDKVYIATKGGHPPINDMSFCRLTNSEIKKDLDESLTRLDTDYIDLYWLHRDNENADIAEVAETLNELIRDGKIRSIGCSNWTGKRLNEFNSYAHSHGLEGFCASQIKWSLAMTSPKYRDDPTLVEMDASEYNFYKKSQIPVMAFASQGKGFFSKIANGGIDALSEKAKARYLCDENLKRYEKTCVIAKKYNTSVGAVAVAWLASMTDITAMPIIGCKNINQLTDSMQAAEIELTPEEINFLAEF